MSANIGKKIVLTFKEFFRVPTDIFLRFTRLFKVFSLYQNIENLNFKAGEGKNRWKSFEKIILPLIFSMNCVSCELVCYQFSVWFFGSRNLIYQIKFNLENDKNFLEICPRNFSNIFHCIFRVFLRQLNFTWTWQDFSLFSFTDPKFSSPLSLSHRKFQLFLPNFHKFN